MAAITYNPKDVSAAVVTEQYVGPAYFDNPDAVTPGQLVCQNEGGGTMMPASAAAAPTAKAIGIAISDPAKTVGAITDVTKGIIDFGDISGITELKFGTPLYLSDTPGVIDTVAGTTSVLIGYVIAGWNDPTPRKLVRVDL